ncbi:candidapepsin-1 precursor [Suhomyces tanzawaensis NRRL Y-17324]|uniref:candidapepsin n=1 Tax=Suhomyces tanzawaensis NRRL Y-17324 TaxID=984487 RepID=A0A1E4SGU9_9ASCO|nr:candidapepsin-1 precursor [Suhomyces tanzawaensis NRRL Y-17324]ODV78731.1 candidapepsin-1 precursor [Suhomyces tanzawaensis NRRL Y-17324]
MVSFGLFTQKAFSLLACSLVVQGLVIPDASTATEDVAKREGPGFLKLDFSVTKKVINGTTDENTHKRADYQVPLTKQNVYYSIDLNFGSQAQTISVDIDTGSSDLWVPDLKTDKAGFDSASSTTFHDLGIPFSIGYVDKSTASGNFVKDSVGIPNGPTLKDFQFADATQSTVTQGGVFGIGPIASESTSTKYPNFPISLKNAGYISKNAYSIYLNSVDATTGSIIFGGIDNAKYEGLLVTLPFTQDSGIVINLDSVTGPDGTVHETNINGILDTGTTVTYLPDDVVSSFAGSIPGAFFLFGRIYLPSCDALPSDQFVSFKFGDANIKVPLSDLVQDNGGGSCLLGIFGNSQSQGFNLLGDSFLRRAYFVADYDAKTAQIAQVKYTSDSNIVAIQ